MWEKTNKIKEKGGIDGAWIYGIYLGLASFNYIIYLTYELPKVLVKKDFTFHVQIFGMEIEF